MTPPYEHIAVLTSFVVSLGFAHVLVGIAALIQSPAKVRISLAHALWTAVSLACLLDLWLGILEFRQRESFPIGLVFLLLAQAASGYLLTALVMPSSVVTEGVADLVEFHDTQHRSYVRAFIGFMLLDYVATFVTEPAMLNPTDIAEVTVALSVALALPVAALFVRRRWLQILAPAVSAALLVLYWVLLFPVFA